MTDNQSLQADEVTALSAIYPDNLTFSDLEQGHLNFEFSSDDKAAVIQLAVTLTEGYPSNDPPNFEISAPFLRSTEKEDVINRLNDIYAENLGESMLHLWIEELRSVVESRSNQRPNPLDSEKESKEQVTEETVAVATVKCPEIHTGPCTEKKKSVFQGHFAFVHSKEQVDAVMSRLKENRKIASATHNISAYRIKLGSGILASCDDDGESKAGSRLLELLTIVDVSNILVVVTRWYGGIKLGPDRFKCINNAARDVLEQFDVLKAGGDSKAKLTNKRS